MRVENLLRRGHDAAHYGRLRCCSRPAYQDTARRLEIVLLHQYTRREGVRAISGAEKAADISVGDEKRDAAVLEQGFDKGEKSWLRSAQEFFHAKILHGKS